MAYNLMLHPWSHDSSLREPPAKQQRLRLHPETAMFLEPELTCNNISAASDNATTVHVTKFLPKTWSCFSWLQLQELELQVLIYNHITSGVSVPPQLLYLVTRSLFPASPHASVAPSNLPLIHTGYWGGRAAMDMEPRRCRRTDGKKWRCSKDVVMGRKYCERHENRGRNRSRKHVETKTTNNQRASTSMNDGQMSGQTLWRFLDDWTRSIDDRDAITSSTDLSISMPRNDSSDFSLKLGIGSSDESSKTTTCEERAKPMAPDGGPLAEALRVFGF